MTLLTRYSSLADKSSSSPSSDSIATPWNATNGNSCKKIEHDPIVGSKVMALLTCYSSLADQSSLSRSSDLPQGIRPRETRAKKKRNPTVGSKVMALFTRYSSLADQSSLSRSSDIKSTPRKTASGNSCRNLSAIKRWDQKL
jgi:hypothetical protein